MIAYRDKKGPVPIGATAHIIVSLDGKDVGEIRMVQGGYQYFPKGSKSGGDIFTTVKKVKRSLEEE